MGIMSKQPITIADIESVVGISAKETRALMKSAFDDVYDVLHVMMAHFDARFNKVEAKLDKHDQQFDRIFNKLDHIDKTLETDEHERLAMTSQLDRHDIWIHGLAKNSGYSLSD